MTASGLRRRDVLVAASCCCGVLAGCSETDASRSEYGRAYGTGYGRGD